VQNNNESMNELSEILKDLVQAPITSLYQENISEDIKSIKSKLNKISSIDKNLSTIRNGFDEKFDEASRQVENIFKQSAGLSNKIDEVSQKLIKLEDKYDRVLDRFIEADKQFEKILAGSNETLAAISAQGKSIDYSYSNLHEKIGTQNNEVLELLADMGRIDNNTNQTKKLVDELLHSNAALSESLKDSALRDESIRKSIVTNRWAVVIGTLLILSIVIVFEMNIIGKI